MHARVKHKEDLNIHGKLGKIQGVSL